MNREFNLKHKDNQQLIPWHKQNLSYRQKSETDIFFENKRNVTNSMHNVDFINIVQKVLCVHWQNDQFGVRDLVKYLGVKRSTFIRRFRDIFATTAVEFLNDYRLVKASQILLNPSLNISEVCYYCGFSDPRYFSKCFRSKFGVNPREYRANYICINESKSMQGEMLVEKALDVLKNENDHRVLSVDSFAEELNVSKATLYRRIKTVTGQSPYEFIRRYRLNKSVDMLVLSKKKIKDIALTVGFNDSKHFSRCFSNEFGVSPLSYRRRKCS